MLGLLRLLAYLFALSKVAKGDCKTVAGTKDDDNFVNPLYFWIGDDFLPSCQPPPHACVDLFCHHL